jgi:hypothetical protein
MPKTVFLAVISRGRRGEADNSKTAGLLHNRTSDLESPCRYSYASYAPRLSEPGFFRRANLAYMLLSTQKQGMGGSRLGLGGLGVQRVNDWPRTTLGHPCGGGGDGEWQWRREWQQPCTHAGHVYYHNTVNGGMSWSTDWNWGAMTIQRNFRGFYNRQFVFALMEPVEFDSIRRRLSR